MTNPNRRAARKLWADALRSGKYEQGDQELMTSDECGDRYCCLGVLADLACKAGVIDAFSGYDGDLYSYAPVMAWVGLCEPGGEYRDGEKPDSGASLALDNDSGKTFAEIADTIEAEPEGMFCDDTQEA